MFQIEITEGAKQLLERHLAESAFTQSVIYIFQQPKLADVTRAEDGSVNWTIDRPTAWCLSICSFENMTENEIVRVEGLPVCLVASEPTLSSRIVLKVKNGEVVVESLPN